MDLSTIIVIVVMTVLSLGGIAWLEVHSRRAHRESAAGHIGDEAKSVDH